MERVKAILKWGLNVLGWVLIGSLTGLIIMSALLAYDSGEVPKIYSADWWDALMAFGAIGAVVVAIWIMFEQRRNAKNILQGSKTDTIKYMLSLINAVDDLINHIKEAKKEDVTDYKSLFKSLSEKMDKLDPFEKGLGDIAITFSDSQNETRKLATEQDVNFETLKRTHWRLIPDSFLHQQARFEICRRQIKKFTEKENLEVNVELRGLPTSLSKEVKVEICDE